MDIRVKLKSKEDIKVHLKPKQSIKLRNKNVYVYDPNIIGEYVELAEDWAKKTDGLVEEEDYSAKAYAIGGVGTETNNSKYYAEQAGISETNASNSATAAATSETNAGNSATSAGNSATLASNKAGEAAVSATNASTSAGTATAQAVIAKGHADNAADSATTATTQAGIATTQAGIATTQAGNAASSASAASGSALSAATSETNASIWAEGTDSQVSDLGGEKSSKGWAERAKELVDSIGTVLHYKGSVATYSDLPSTGQEVGDVWNVLSDGSNYAWDGTGWDDLSGIVDLSAYRTSADQDIIDLTKANTDLSNLTATGEAKFDAKQDVISDLATIRAGAALGATSVQSVTTGTTNGTIKVDGSDVSVYGLGSAAYTSSTDYDTVGSASTAETNAKNYADSLASNYATAAQGALADTAVQPADLATVATTGDYDDLSGTPTLAAVATSGSYNDLSNKPTIPAAQVNSDWNATSGVAQILNKPSLATVATSGAYADLSGTPTIPTVNDATLTIQKNGVNVQTFTANSATNATANITVPTDTADLTNGAGFITGITSSNVTTALGYTPYNSTNPSGYQTAADVASAIAGKQDTLVSGTNIKTINGSSVLGSGDLTISATASFASLTGDPGDNEDLRECFDAKADTDLSNLDETGKSTGAELSMPSDNYINLTVPASGSFYTAPANGYVSMYVLTNGSGAITLDNVDIQANIGSVVWTAGTNGLSTYVPVKKGQAVRIGYVSISQFLSFKFIYAEGEI